MAVIGGSWTPNIIWNLSQHPRRFSELKDDIPGISAKVLTTRLKKLEADGVITRTVQPTSPPTVEYALTELGKELKPVLEAIVSVSHRLKLWREGKSTKAA
jgi:DNA-binding HxlR family transcriptional regulator